MKRFQVNDNLFYAENPHVAQNTFIGRAVTETPLPQYENIKHLLPRPVWPGHADVLACYDKAWQLAFGNLRKAKSEAGFVSDFIDTAFNGYLFMWDSAFIVMFGKYARHIFDFQKTLDNFYARQHKDGFICRELCEEAAGEQFTRDDPASTGPNILPWAEWEYFLQTGDKERLAQVFDPLLAYHKWLQLNRSWPDGGYWSCGFACGMDNQPRQAPGYDPMVSHGFMTWVDSCAQQYLSARLLVQMGRALGRESETAWLTEECDRMQTMVNDTMWDETTAFYYDRRRDGSLSGVKTVGAYWTLLAGLVPAQRADAFVAHLENETEFKRPGRIPSLSADHPQYCPDNGGYWKGGVWAPTNYMTLRGLSGYGYHALAHRIAKDFLAHVVSAFNTTGTLWENYSPEQPQPGQARPDFVGWTGLVPINILFEYVFGIQPDYAADKLVWRVALTEEHGVQNYRFGDAVLTLHCAARADANEKPIVTVEADHPVTVQVIWPGGSFTVSNQL